MLLLLLSPWFQHFLKLFPAQRNRNSHRSVFWRKGRIGILLTSVEHSMSQLLLCSLPVRLNQFLRNPPRLLTIPCADQRCICLLMLQFKLYFPYRLRSSIMTMHSWIQLNFCKAWVLHAWLYQHTVSFRQKENITLLTREINPIIRWFVIPINCVAIKSQTETRVRGCWLKDLNS